MKASRTSPTGLLLDLGARPGLSIARSLPSTPVSTWLNHRTQGIRFVGGTSITGLDGGNTSFGPSSPLPAVNDLVVLVGGHPDNDTIGPSTAGYTAITTHLGSDPRAGAWYKFMGSTPDTTVTVLGGGNVQSGIAYATFVFRGVDLVNPLDTAATTASGNDCPPITTVTPGAVVIAAMVRTNSVTNITGTPTDYGNALGGTLAADTNRAGVRAAIRMIVTPQTEDPSAYSATSGNEFAMTIALRPATS